MRVHPLQATRETEGRAHISYAHFWAEWSKLWVLELLQAASAEWSKMDGLELPQAACAEWPKMDVLELPQDA